MTMRRVWLGLVGLCVGVACALAIALAVVSATAALAVARQVAAAVEKHDAAGRQQRFMGVVTDAVCGARHPASNMTAAECTQACAKKGARYMLVAADKAYMLGGDTTEVARLAGQRAQVVGSLEGNTLKVESITAVPTATRTHMER